MAEFYQNPNAPNNTSGPHGTTTEAPRTGPPPRGPAGHHGGAMQTIKNVLSGHEPHHDKTAAPTVHDTTAAQQYQHNMPGEFAANTAGITAHPGGPLGRIPAETHPHDTVGDAFGRGVAGVGIGTAEGAMLQQPGTVHPATGPAAHGLGTTGAPIAGSTREGYGTGAPLPPHDGSAHTHAPGTGAHVPHPDAGVTHTGHGSTHTHAPGTGAHVPHPAAGVTHTGHGSAPTHAPGTGAHVPHPAAGGTHTGPHGTQPHRKPTLGDKVIGSAEAAVGRLIKNTEMQDKGAERKAGLHHPTDDTHISTTGRLP